MRQGMHSELPVVFWNSPGLQKSHLSCATEFWAEPTAHLEHTDWPGVPAKRPGRHSRHEVDLDAHRSIAAVQQQPKHIGLGLTCSLR